MKRILSVGLLMVSALAMTGCEDIPGVLIVTKNFTVLVKGKEKTVPIGDHKTSLDFKRKKVVATIKTGSDSLKVELDVPKGAQIPSNGSFELKSSQTGQPFDVLGEVQTHVTDSGLYREYAMCEKREYQTICGPKGCYTTPVTRPGRKHVEFFYRDTDQAMQLDMTAEGGPQNRYAHFEGRARYSEKIVTYEGACF